MYVYSDMVGMYMYILLSFIYRYTRASMGSNKDRLESIEKRLQVNVIFTCTVCVHVHVTVIVEV